MADLPTNYLDDILAQSMNGKRKFRITRPDGTFEEVIIEDISEYSQTGSTFGAGDINRTNQAVNEKFDSEDVVDPMLTTEPGFAADAYKTKLQFDEQNKKLNNPHLLGGYVTITQGDNTIVVPELETRIGCILIIASNNPSRCAMYNIVNLDNSTSFVHAIIDSADYTVTATGNTITINSSSTVIAKARVI